MKKNMLKLSRLLFISAVMMMVCAPMVLAQATDASKVPSEKDERPLNWVSWDEVFSDARRESHEEAFKAYEQMMVEYAKYLEEVGIRNHDAFWYEMNVPLKVQEEYYYCGPASVQQAMNYHRNKFIAAGGNPSALPSQDVLATDIGTTQAGSNTWRMRQSLNGNGLHTNPSYNWPVLLGYNGVTYQYLRIAQTSNPYSTIFNSITADVSSQQKVPIVLVETAKLPRYEEHPACHYMAISGVLQTAQYYREVRTVDPNDSTVTGRQGIYWDRYGDSPSDPWGVYAGMAAQWENLNETFIY